MHVRNRLMGPATAAVLALGVVFAAPVSASGTAAVSSGRVAAGGPANTTKPVVKIEGSGSALKFVPNSAAIKWSGSSTGTCTSTNYGFKAVNKTTASQTLTYKGTAIGPAVAPGKAEFVCAWGSGTTTAVLNLKADPRAKLTLHIS